MNLPSMWSSDLDTFLKLNLKVIWIDEPESFSIVAPVLEAQDVPWNYFIEYVTSL